MYSADRGGHSSAVVNYAAIIQTEERRQNPIARKLNTLLPVSITANFVLFSTIFWNTISDFKVGTVMHRYNTSDLNSTQALDQIRDIGLPVTGIVNIMFFVMLIAVSVIVLTNNPCSRALNLDTETRATDGTRRSTFGLFWRRATVRPERDEHTPLLTEGNHHGDRSHPAPQT